MLGAGIVASNDAGSLRIGRGQSAAAQAGQAPVLRVVAKPRDAVHWALYYPPVLYAPPGKKMAEDEADPRYLAARASSLLAVGQVDPANADIERVLTIGVHGPAELHILLLEGISEDLMER